MKKRIHLDHEKIEEIIEAIEAEGKDPTLKEIEKRSGYSYSLLYANGYSIYTDSYGTSVSRENAKLKRQLKKQEEILKSLGHVPAPKTEPAVKPQKLSEEFQKSYAQVWNWKVEHQELTLNLEHSELSVGELEDVRESIEFMAKQAVKIIDRIITKVEEQNNNKK